MEVKEKWQVCGVCGYPLDRFTKNKPTDTVLGWGHFRPPDDGHVAVPVDADQIRHNQQCDFCGDEPVVLEIVAHSFEMMAETAVTPAQMSVGGWGACTDCGSLIRRNRWSALISRVRTRTAAFNLPRCVLEDLYSRLQPNIIEILPYDEWRARQDYPLPSE